ncbi:hypothetical protein KSB_47360 [Ktedonobacter robiniae]|uniref:Uncharacterized protein n=1 Tax=Ktedonobacter robiniae TaxID=2778365 RepID=A0ABQ3UU04_9CHLR|nr:hypothetical protein KSB_47360 [Ktedonobacter robiniae]
MSYMFIVSNLFWLGRMRRSHYMLTMPFCLLFPKEASEDRLSVKMLTKARDATRGKREYRQGLRQPVEEISRFTSYLASKEETISFRGQECSYPMGCFQVVFIGTLPFIECQHAKRNGGTERDGEMT